MDDWYTSRQSREFAAKLERIFFMARLGRALRFRYDQIVRQPLPQELQELMRRLEGVERRTIAGRRAQDESS
jgi:hypothetical protein